MKKLFLFAALAATVFASCGKNEVFEKKTDQTPVSFGVYVPKATKATPGTQTTATLKTDGFGVLAFYTNDGAYSASATPNFMYNTKVAYTTAWTYTPVKYWPNEHGTNAVSSTVDKVSFFAYAPWVSVPAGNLASGSTGLSEGITSLTGNATAGDPKVTFKIPGKAEDQIDLLWGVAASDAVTANAQGSPANTINVGKPFIDMTKQQCDGTVKYLFKHALTKLDLKVQAIVDDATDASNNIADGTKVFVRKVEIFGKFATTSVLNLNNTTANIPLWETPTATSDGTTPVFVFTDGKDDSDDLTADGDESADFLDRFVVYANEGVDNTARPLLKDNHHFLIIPTDLHDGTNPDHGFKVRITYDVETADANLAGLLTDGSTHGSKVKNVITTKDKAYLNFEGGKVCTITLKLGLTSVQMEASVDDWGINSNADVYLPQNVD